MTITEIKHPSYGLVGWLHTVECQSTDSLLIFQLPRTTNQLSEAYMNQAKATLGKSLPEGRNALIIGADVNIYELAGPDALILKLKGFI